MTTPKGVSISRLNTFCTVGLFYKNSNSVTLKVVNLFKKEFWLFRKWTNYKEYFQECIADISYNYSLETDWEG